MRVIGFLIVVKVGPQSQKRNNASISSDNVGITDRLFPILLAKLQTSGVNEVKNNLGSVMNFNFNSSIDGSIVNVFVKLGGAKI